MKNETIKTYKILTLDEAFQAAKDGVPVAFSDDGKGWHYMSLIDSIAPKMDYPYETAQGGFRKYCATVTEIDPCQSPAVCPELEPWMAYVGLNISEDDFPLVKSVGNEVRFFSSTHKSIKWENGFALTGGGYIAIDVRKTWAQKNFPEHCRIRNYQEPEADAMAKQCLKLVEEIDNMNERLRQANFAKNGALAMLDHEAAKEKRDTARLDALFKSGGFPFYIGPDYTEQVTTRAQIDELIMMNHE